MPADIRKLIVQVDETRREMGRDVNPPTRRALAMAVITITGDDVTLRSARRVRVGAASRDAAGAASQIDVRPDDAVCVEYENGVRLWMRADDLLRERGRLAATRGNEAPAWEIDSAARVSSVRDELAGGADRGLVGLGIKALEFFGIDVAAKSARLIGDKFELKQLKLPEGATPGLFRVSLGAEPALRSVRARCAPGLPLRKDYAGRGGYGTLARSPTEPLARRRNPLARLEPGAASQMIMASGRVKEITMFRMDTANQDGSPGLPDLSGSSAELLGLLAEAAPECAILLLRPDGTVASLGAGAQQIGRAHV